MERKNEFKAFQVQRIENKIGNIRCIFIGRIFKCPIHGKYSINVY